MPVQQHPLPQDISSYRFRLIGDMTIKQFAALAVGGIAGFVLFSIKAIPFFFRYPFGFVCIMLGIGTAFIPIQGRPLEQVLIAFIKSIYSPTIFIWKQNLLDGQDVPQKVASPFDFLLKFIPIKKPAIENTASNNPSPQVLPKTSVAQTTAILPEPTVKPTEGNAPNNPFAPATSVAVSPPASIIGKTPEVPIVNVSVPTPPNPEVVPLAPAPVSEPIIPQTVVTTPVVNSVTVDTQTVQAPIQKTASNSPVPTTTLPIPLTPSTPNSLVGMTLTPDSKILDSALVEIKSSDGMTVRATKSNRLGQFLFARPLENGTYQIITEREGYTFELYSLILDGNVVKPLKIQAKAT